MAQAILALVEVNFKTEEDLKKGTEIVQNGLREAKTALGFSVHEGKITFQVSPPAQNSGYPVLTQIKAELSAKGLEGFSISIREFTETKQFTL